jgi:hypothetical protein
MHYVTISILDRPLANRACTIVQMKAGLTVDSPRAPHFA